MSNEIFDFPLAVRPDAGYEKLANGFIPASDVVHSDVSIGLVRPVLLLDDSKSVMLKPGMHELFTRGRHSQIMLPYPEKAFDVKT